MPRLPLYNVNGQNAGEFFGSAKLFGRQPNDQVVHSALVWYQASRRRGTQSSLTRAEVSGSGKKPWKQKGTGRARAGHKRSPLWRKGGVIFAPKPRNYGYSLPKKVRQLALKIVLSERAAGGKIKVAEELRSVDRKTRSAVKFFQNIGVAGKVLVVLGQDEKSFATSARNIRGVNLLPAKDLNIFDLLKAEWVVLEKAAVQKLEEALA